MAIQQTSDQAEKLHYYAGTLYGKYLEQRYQKLPYTSASVESHKPRVKPRIVEAFNAACEKLAEHEQIFLTKPDSQDFYDEALRLIDRTVTAGRAYFYNALN